MKKHLLSLFGTAIWFLPTIAQAQTYTPSNRNPVADNSQIGTIVNPTGANNFNIDGGLRRGQNLFHSFTDFSIRAGGSANFTNPAGNQSIITRVTGNSFSDINGLLNTNGANFLLINPNGVVFGTGAKLDVGKAFVTSTASGIDFVDAQGRNYNFGTNRAGDAPLLTIDPNVAFNPARLIIGGSGSKGIENYGALETKNPNQYIGLIGGNVTFDGGKINAPSGRVDLGGLLAPGTIGLGVEGNILRAQFPTNVTRGDVSFNNRARVSVAGSGGGDIAITARNLDLLGASVVRGGIEEGLGTPASVAGDIKLDATEAIVIVGSGTAIANNVRFNSRGNGGNTTINAGSFSLRDGAQLQSSTYGQGNTGNVTVTAKDGVSLVNANIFSNIESGGAGKGGNIEVNAGSLSLQDGAQLQTITNQASDTQPAGIGDAGNIKVKVSGAIDIAGTKDGSFSGINSSVLGGAVGKGGNITIDAGSLSAQDSSLIAAANLGQGHAGEIDIKTQGNITLSGTNDLQAILSDPNDSRSFITTQSNGQGNAGKISIETPGKLSLLNRGVIFSTISAQAIGDSQGISIKASEVELNNYAKIAAATFGRGNGGDIGIVTSGDLTIAGKSFISTSTFNTENNQFQGNAGNISLDTGNFKLLDSNMFSATSRTGNAGNIGIKARGDITLAGTATFVNDQPTNISRTIIASSSFGVGNAGKISIDNPSGKLSLSFASIGNSIGEIDAKNTSGISQGITINAHELELKNNSFISSDLFGKGRGGDIDIKTTGDITISGNNNFDYKKITQFNISAISSNTYGIGDGGKISIETPGKLSLDSTAFIFSIVAKDAQGTSKGIKINVGELNLTNFGFISSDTQGKNPGGDIDIVTTGAVNIKNGGIGANSVKSTFSIDLPGIGTRSVSSTGEGKAGNISISSDRLNLDSGVVFAIGNSGSGGNITLNLSDKLLLRNGSQITTSSGADFGDGTGGGNGGNITINSPLIVALPVNNFGSNDIAADAYTGKGGNVKITSQGLFGIQYRATDSRFTNDITASSDFGQSGSVQISTPGTDPGKDKGELTGLPNDASKQISQACGASQWDNKFYITGRGGLPPNASEPQESDALWEDARAVKTKPATTASLPPKYPPPAIGWVFQPDGRVRLIAAQTTVGATEPRVGCPSK
ncbi:filamentous hemagglutinin N-terminal domain-containing protein [Chamaesiphon sp. VAR_48_metabat_135_sub]|uniref:two-partner secretion domain-containing protein n=1 Tax=Chamaesiphon sp. VAR_48_metabat_135_sub TaxID=2964699 RepID=UPI00286AD8DD|nr:filamentous hemagglutinin N-terminal domain-containing protein [Chamaesiphon sp. VAR_48_metabat_135_sub]